MGPLDGWYAQRRGLRARQIVFDVLVACWVIICALLGAATARTVGAVAVPLHSGRDQAQRLADYARQAADQSGQIPGLGDGLSKPFADGAVSLQDAAAAIDQQIVLIGHVALLAGWLVFALPVALLLLIWIPVRLRFRRRSIAARQLLDNGAHLDLFALRALATQPLHVIAAMGDDPAAAWRQGDPATIRALASVELRRSGLPAHRD